MELTELEVTKNILEKLSNPLYFDKLKNSNTLDGLSPQINLSIQQQAAMKDVTPEVLLQRRIHGCAEEGVLALNGPLPIQELNSKSERTQTLIDMSMKDMLAAFGDQELRTLTKDNKRTVISNDLNKVRFLIKQEAKPEQIKTESE